MLADELGIQGRSVAPRAVAKLLHDSGYSLQYTDKSHDGRDHRDRAECCVFGWWGPRWY